MKLGVISDTHDDALAVRRAVRAFNAEAVSLVMHAGDISSPELASAFEGLKAPFVGVCGNNDHDWQGLRGAFAPYGQIYRGYYDIALAGVRLTLMHELRGLHQLPLNKKYDVVIYGHSHHFDVRNGHYLLVNPGQCKSGGEEPTVAILDLCSLTVRKIVLDTDEQSVAQHGGKER